MFCFFEGYRVSECRNAYAYFVSNTGYRFITKKKTCYAVSVPKPEGGYVRRSVGFVRIGEKKALRKATKIRNQIGKELWGRCWDRVRKQFNLLARLPKSLDPRLTTIDGKQYYVARYTKYDENDQKREHFIKVSVSAHGKLAAWTLAKRKLLKAHSDVMDVLLHIEKVSSVQLK
ncbi:Fe3+-citrate ABC transporter substrate-binding protein (plasmid) [Vibrio alginolyticus]|uniref:Fe3+-citrate ABC transporter substrate-binding protein n=1 Tax=Vibrio alginolyticus TaxID=663 RepID=UPI001C063EDC|nr:Fe3+-citrate ABC transporter substrate-binding protein [Vibrio alginolyticus]